MHGIVSGPINLMRVGGQVMSFNLANPAEVKKLGLYSNSSVAPPPHHLSFHFRDLGDMR